MKRLIGCQKQMSNTFGTAFISLAKLGRKLEDPSQSESIHPYRYNPADAIRAFHH